MDEENEYTLTRYYISSPDSLIGRVAPCLRALAKSKWCITAATTWQLRPAETMTP